VMKVRNMVTQNTRLREKVRRELLSEGPKVEAVSEDEQFLMKLKETILARLGDEQLSVESLAEQLGWSRSQFYRKVTALTGTPVNELIRSFRLKKAAQLLDQRWGPVAQVAYEVGFSNPSYFGKVFKEEFGVLPSEYRSS
jgi:AraC-like DNA-binding protein